MGIVTTVEALRGAVNEVLPAVPNNPMIKALSCVLIDADASTMTATNLDLGITTMFPVQGNASMLVPAKLLAQILSTLPQGEVTLQDLDNGKIRISAGRNVSHVATMPIDDYPQLPETDTLLDTLSGGALDTLVRSVAYAAADDDSRPVLKAVNVERHNGTVTASASDGYRLGRATLAQTDGADYSAMILRSTLAAVAKMNVQADDAVELRTNKLQRHYEFRGSNWRIIGRTVDGRYPDVARIIPREHGTAVVINDTAALNRALQLATLFDANYLVHVVVEADRVVFRTSAETGDGEAVVPAQVTGPTMETAANARLLRDAVAAIRGPVLLRLQSKVSPIVVLSAADGNAGTMEASQLHIVMPMSVR